MADASETEQASRAQGIRRFLTLDNFFKVFGAIMTVIALWLSYLKFQDSPFADPVVRWVNGSPDARNWNVYIANDGDKAVTVYRIRWGVIPADKRKGSFVECFRDPDWISEGSLVHISPGQVGLASFSMPSAGCTSSDARAVHSIPLSSQSIDAMYAQLLYSDTASDWQLLWPFVDEAPPLPPTPGEIAKAGP